MCGAEKSSILVVDDPRDKLLSYDVLLKDMGENLLTASSAAESVQALLVHEVAVILINLCTLGPDGFDLARMIRKDPRLSKTAIIFISAAQTETDHLKGYDAGAVDYIPVTLVPELLRAKVRVFVDLYKKTKQLEQLNSELERRVTERTTALELTNSRLLKSEQGRRLSLAAANMGSWEYDAGEDIWYCDEGLNRILGIDETEPLGCLDSACFLDHNEWHGFTSAFGVLTPRNATFQKEMQIRCRDGRSRICLVAAAASYTKDGTLERIDGVMVDITDRKEVERLHKLLAREVDHRARNALANVQAIMRLTRAETMEDYADKVERRVHALAHTHELLSNARWQGADICLLVRDELAPYGPERTSIRGPSVILSPEKSQSVALILHELAINAAVHGALSSTEGLVIVEWEFKENILTLCWSETDGPPVALPVRTGFGTKIINASLNAAKGDSALFEWDPAGVRCRLHIQCGAAPVGQEFAGSLELAHAATGSRRRILVVEDEALVGMLTCDYLDSLGYCAVGPFSDIDSARVAVATEAFDLALLDVSLGGRPIYPVAELLRSAGYPIVFVTGFSDEGIDPEFASIEVLTKPAERSVLAAAIERSLAEGVPFRRSA